jgi:hypothetical protein
MIRLELPELPPSSNHAYFNMRGKGRALTAEGRGFLLRAKTHFAQRYPIEMKLFAPNYPYLVAIRFFFEDIENKGFRTGDAKTRYKIFDGGNRTKLLEDALKDAGGIDDSQVLTSIWMKSKGSPERTIIWAWSTAQENTPFDDALRTLY